ncbi:MAG: beta-propeller domain-containing protein [Verrucomicrobia bacterium]|nr:beta-propeller domain-containing protein [Verrucomicrobiota bacterium]
MNPITPVVDRVPFARRLFGFLLLAWLAGVGLVRVTADDPSAAQIVSLRAVGTELHVIVAVPPGQRRLTLESRSRLLRGTWTPRDVQWSDRSVTTELTFTLPLGDGMEMLRVRDEVDQEVGLPANFFRGRKAFRPSLQKAGSGVGVVGGIVANMNFDATPNGTVSQVTGGETRAVVESDIWKVEGRTAYFFNQQRGLQVIDLTLLDEPRMLGQLPLAVWGEQLYRLPASAASGSTWLALLAQQGCTGSGSEVLLVEVTAGTPRLALRLPVRGQIRETRLVGDVLYVASNDWVPGTAEIALDGTLLPVAYESRTVISTFNLANPAAPVPQPVVDLPVHPLALSATDRFLFVAASGSRTPLPFERLAEWALLGNHGVLVFDLSDPAGTVKQLGYFRTAGRVFDKFKLGTFGDGGNWLAAVSQVDGEGRMVTDPRDPTGNLLTWEWTPPKTVLETYSLSDFAQSAPVGQLTLVTNETLFGTRFSGNRAYVVTFRVVDPLWIVDLSQPTQPVIRGELQIPGYSTYLQPLADNTRLLALGVDGSRTTVQLFDVADADRPTLLSKVLLGAGWSWSEGNADEKAFQVFPELGLALVPWQGELPGRTAGSWFQGVQLIDVDLKAGRLEARGVVDHALQARRATWIDERIVSVSAQELLTVDATDRDQPRVTGELPLSPQVDRVFVRGGQLVQLRQPAGQALEVALATAAEPERARVTLALESLPLLGADLREDHLVVLQGRASIWTSDLVTITNVLVSEEGRPPIRERRTRVEVVLSPPPLVTRVITNIFIHEEDGQRSLTNVVVQSREVPRPQATNLVSTTTEKVRPPSPLDPTPSVYRLTWIRPEFVPEPDSWQTNLVEWWEWVAQPPVLVTNVHTYTTWVPRRVPGAVQLSVVEFAGDQIQVRGRQSWDSPTNFIAAPMVPLWVGDSQVVWTEAPGTSGWMDWTSLRVSGGGLVTFGPGVALPRVTDLAVPGLIWWGPWWWQETRNFLAFDVSAPELPVWASQVQLGGTNQWNSFSRAFVADGKVFLSHRTSRLVKAGLPAPGPDFSIYEHDYALDVLDFADLTEPVVRTPVALPGRLEGVSHAGSLVYAQGGPVDESTTGSFVHALAYDGLQASWVGALPLPELQPAPFLVTSDGQVFLGRASTNAASALEVWAVSVAGTFERYGTIPLSAPAEGLNESEAGLVVSAGSEFQLYVDADPEILRKAATAERPCGLSFDWTHVAVSAESGLWIPRGQLGLWHAPLVP